MDTAVKHIIDNERLKRLQTQNVKSVLSSALLGWLLMFTQAHETNIPIANIYLWSFLLLMISVARLVASLYFKKHPVISVEQNTFRLNMLRAGVIVTGVCWGANPYLAGEHQSIQLLFFSSFIIAGMSSAAVIAYAIDKPSALAYMYFAVIPLIVYFVIIGTPQTLVMAFAGAIFVFFMVYSIHELNNLLVENIMLRIKAEQFDEQIRQMAYYDALTGLPNRRLLQDSLDHALSIHKRHLMSGAVIFIDLDNFKKLNDTQGHEMGDLLLKQVADRLKGVIRESDLVSRLGGDEFIILLENLSMNAEIAANQAKEVGNKILNEFNKPYQINQEPYFVSPSIGIALFPTHGKTHDDLLKHADTAMYEAKRAGRNTVRVFDIDMDLRIG